MRGISRCLAAVAVAVAVAAAVGAGASAHGSKPPKLQFLGQAIVPTGATFAGTTIGGLSSITYDKKRGVFYSLSDDQSQFNPARFYTLHIDLSDGSLANGDVHFDAVTTLLAPNGLPYAPFSLDPEGLTLTKKGELIVTSEGIAVNGIAPFVRRYSLGGTFLGDLTVPDAFLPTSPTHGVRQNLAFEAAAVAPNGKHLFVGMEAALAQDGPAASLTNGSASRILRYNLANGRLERQNVYFTDPIAEAPVPATQFAVSGLVELLPFNDEFMLSMERSFSVGAPGTPATRSSSTRSRFTARRTSTATTASPGAQEAAAGAEDAAARPGHARHTARQRRGHDARASASGRSPLARARQRQQLRGKPVHAVPAVRAQVTSASGLGLGRAPEEQTQRARGGIEPAPRARRGACGRLYPSCASRVHTFETTCATAALPIAPARLNAPAAKTFAPLAVS